MSHLIRARRAGVLTVASAVGALAIAGPAMADATVSPTSAQQTGGADLSFHITNTERSPMIRVRLSLPVDSPIAEVYPLSSPDWAPDITQQKLSTPLTSIHGGTPVTSATRDITWIAIPGKGITPGGSDDFSVSLGPLPTLSQMQFDVVPTYADGHAGPAVAPVVLKLTPATPQEQAAAHAGHEGGTGTDGGDPDAALFAQTVAQSEHGPSIWSMGGWIMAALAVLGAIYAVLRSRRRGEAADADAPDEAAVDEAVVDEAAVDEAAVNEAAVDEAAVDEAAPEQPQPKEPVGAGARRKSKVSGWRYQDDPE